MDGLLYTIAVATGCALFGVIVGSAVQRTAKFLYPTDWMSITIAMAIIADMILGLAPWDKMWYIPFIAGFAVGYLLVGRQSYIMVSNINIESKYLVLRPWVLYEHDGAICRQRQNNRDLLRRQFLGIHNVVVDIDSGGGPPQISHDWTSDSKYPLFPRFVKDMLVLEDIKEDSVVVKIWWRIKARVPTTHIQIAFASAASKLELLKSAEVLEDQQSTISRLYDEVHKLRSAQGPKLMEMAIRVNDRATVTSPENRMYSLLVREDGKFRNTEKKKEVPEQKKEVEEGAVEEPDEA